MKSSLFEHYKKKYGSGGKLPVRKTGMWYQDGDVVVPSNEITMKGPEGEKDYFDSPILGIGLLSGDTQVMEPGKDYLFPNDEAVVEKKMQMGAKTKAKEVTPEQEARLRKYLKTPQSNEANLPNWLDLSSGATNYARRRNQMTTQELMETPGDISNQVKSAFDQGIEYSIDAGNQLGRFSTQGVYKPFGENSLQDIYSGLTLSKSGKNNSLVISPTQQQVGFRGKTGNINYKRKMTDDETISELAFNLNVLPEALNLYGQGSITDAGVGRTTDGQLMFNPQYKAQAGIRGTVGQLDYNMSGAYDPQQGYSYQGDAELNLLKDRLSLRGNVSGSEKEGLESLSAEARAKLLKNLQVSAGYRQSGNNPGSYNIGLSYNKAFQEGGWANWKPNTGKPYLRTSPAGNAGYSDNARVVTPFTGMDDATRARLDAQKAEEARRKRSGVISQGTPETSYQKAKRKSSFVEQEKERTGSASPMSYVLDMVNPTTYAFAATDLVGNTGSAVSNVAQGNFKEAGSDLLNAGINALQVIPAAKAVKPFGSSLLKGVSKYADDVVQTSKIAGKPALPTYKNVYRAEHANFNTVAKPDDLTGRWALDNPKDAEFYVSNLKTPRGNSYTTSNYFKGEVEPVRIMRDRLPEYKMKQQFAEGMPEEARIMSMGTGKLTDKELASVLGDGAADRMRKGILTEMDYNTMSTAPFMYNTTEGILDANRINQLRKGENTFLGRGKTNLFPDQKQAIDYISNQSKGQKNSSLISKYLPFSTYKNGGEVEDDDDKEMVEGIADILRRVKDKKNRKQIAKKMVEDFEEEEVEYNLDNFMRAAKLMQMGGMSIPGVNGSVVASVPMTLQSQYKKKKK